MAFIVGVPPRGRASASTRQLMWYAALHRFNSAGKHLRTEASFLARAALGSELDHAETKLGEMIRELGPVTHCDIEIRLFSVTVGGHKFGLVDASVPKENYQRVDLLPNGLAFLPPWNGNYDT